MSTFELLAILITLAAFFSYVNHRWVRLPATIGLMVIALGLSVLLVLAGFLFPPLVEYGRALLEQVDFNKTLMGGMLGFLLFAGALHVDLNDLREHTIVVLTLATFGTLLSTFIVGGLMFLGLEALGTGLAPVWCFLFGALISPTDPIAVLGIFKRLGVPRALEMKICGESLFNDGVGVVVFLVIFSLAGLDPAHADLTSGGVVWLFLQETLGGALFGLGIGAVAYHMLKSVDQYQVEIFGSLALVCGGYALAMRLHVSGPIAMVVAGLLIGNHGRTWAMSEQTRRRLDSFWELVDEFLNAVLFVLIGLELLVVSFTGRALAAGLLAIAVVLAARFVAVGLLMQGLRASGGASTRSDRAPHTIKLLVWGGLRGGISVALALSIPAMLHDHEVPQRQLILTMTYIVVVFSIIVQGLTVGPLLKHWGLSGAGHS